VIVGAFLFGLSLLFIINMVFYKWSVLGLLVVVVIVNVVVVIVIVIVIDVTFCIGSCISICICLQMAGLCYQWTWFT